MSIPPDLVRRTDEPGLRPADEPTSRHQQETLQCVPLQELIVAGDADIFPPSHAVELFGLLGGGKQDPGWDGSGRPASRLAILPGLTHYNIFSAPALAATVIPFLDEPAPKGPTG